MILVSAFGVSYRNMAEGAGGKLQCNGGRGSEESGQGPLKTSLPVAPTGG